MHTIAVTLEPEYFGFFVTDTGAQVNWSRDDADRESENGFALQRHGIAIRLLSEFSPVSIEVVQDDLEPAIGSTAQWDHVVECSILSRTTHIALQSPFDAEPFALIAMTAGWVRLRIFWGGQTSGMPDGSTADFYRVQLWPAPAQPVSVLKGELRWPRPAQPWERRSS